MRKPMLAQVTPAGPVVTSTTTTDHGTFTFGRGPIGFTSSGSGVQPIRADAGGTGGDAGSGAGTGGSTGGDGGGAGGTGDTGGDAGKSGSTGGDSGGGAGGSTAVTFTPPALPDGTKVSGRQNEPKDGDAAKDGAGKDGEKPTGKDGAAPERVEDLPPWAQKIIKEARQGEGDHRVRANETEAKVKALEDERQKMLGKIAEALGVKSDKDGEAEPPDPAKLTDELTKTTGALREARVELAVHDIAVKAEGNARALLDSRQFAGKIHKLDPEASDFKAKLTELIKKEISDDPARFRVAGRAPAAPKGADFTGGPGASADDPEQMSVDDFRRSLHGKAKASSSS